MTAHFAAGGGSNSLRALWKRPAVRAFVFQSILLTALVALALAIYWNVSTNLPRLQLSLGYGFLWEPASFELGDNPIGYRAGESYLKALVAGLANTLKVAILGIALSTVLGTLIALCRLSTNGLLSGFAWAYVEVMRNIPLLLQILFWHTFVVRQLPIPRQAWNPFPGVFLSNRGLIVPTIAVEGSVAAALTVGILTGAMVILLAWRLVRRRVASGRSASPTWFLGLGAILLLGCLLSVQLTTITLDAPVLRGFNFVGGATLTPEFVALLFALVTYQAGFSAETIRSGILGVQKGQVEAARSLGLSRTSTMRLVILPQALRIVVPPLTSQYLSLTKNSSLAVAIGYPDLVRVGTVVLSDTGRSIECISIILVVYLTLSLLTAWIMNVYNRRIALRGARP